MSYESQGEKAFKIVGYGILLILAWVFYQCTDNADPLHHCIFDTLKEIVEHIR